jgi:diguanylate cyclase (GGDEF)-like protein
LTGVANRRRFAEALAAAWATRQMETFAVLMIDVDEFKKYNDHFGHAKGDSCLRLVAAAMESRMPDGALFARYGGEEFVVLLPRATTASTSALADALLMSVRDVHMPQCPHAQRGSVSVSVGAALASRDDVDAGATVARADAALYASKHSGRDRATLS